MKKRIEQITWETFRPFDWKFPCDVCHTREATYFVAISDISEGWNRTGIEPRIPVCEKCSRLSAEEIVGPFLQV